MTKLATPDVTTAQFTGLATALLGAGTVLFKLNISDAERAAIVGVIATLVPVTHMLADAIVRHGRAKTQAALIAARPADYDKNAPPGV